MLFINRYYYVQMLLCLRLGQRSHEKTDDSKPIIHVLFSSQAEPAETVAGQKLLSHKTEWEGMQP